MISYNIIVNQMVKYTNSNYGLKFMNLSNLNPSKS
jgi:hypothetical protein